MITSTNGVKTLQTVTKIFDGQEVLFRQNPVNSQHEVRIDEVAKFCGWTKFASSGNEVIRWSRVNEHLKELGVSTCGHGDFIPEYIMYPLIGKANNDRATQFMLWAGKILVEIRTKGGYISDAATEEQLEKLQEVISFKKITNILSNCKALELEEKVNEILQNNIGLKAKDRDAYHVGLNKTEYKQKLREHIRKAIINRPMPYDINNAIEVAVRYKILDALDRDLLSTQKRSGGTSIGMAKRKINSMYPKQDDFITLDTHGISNNYQYITTEDGTFKTDTYQKWLREFPVHQLPSMDYYGVDFEKPVELFIEYICLDSIDQNNMDKATIDIIFHELGIDDNIVSSTNSKKVGSCNSYKDGKIRFYMRNL